MHESFLYCLIGLILGLNINKNDLYFRVVRNVLSQNCISPYRYSSICTFISVLLFVTALVVTMFSEINLLLGIPCVLLTLLYGIISTWFVTKLALRYDKVGLFLIFTFPVIYAIIYSYNFSRSPFICLLSFSLYGFYIRNIPFGMPHNLPLHRYFVRRIISKGYSFTITPSRDISSFIDSCNEIPDFSYAGVNYGIKLPQRDLYEYNAAKYGIYPNTNTDSLPLIQKLIDEIGEKGGGRIFFPRGRYLLNYHSKNVSSIYINHSNIEICGEHDEKGRNNTTFISCQSTTNSERYPWLSPFIITTGEKLQRSNYFWGVDFYKKKERQFRSDSLVDNGTDGKILEPPFLCNITKNASKGSKVIYVDKKNIKSKYVLLTLVNTDSDDTLLKSLLGVDKFREEWTNANRAAVEEAPSFQYLIEIDNVSNNEITLKQPLRCDVDIKNLPALYEVELIENISIHHINLATNWCGSFRHHGFPFYYTVRESQDMDYGWNGINIKRAAHSTVHHVNFENFTNPIYILDSRNTTVEYVNLYGYDGHQGLKVYGHSCDNLLQNINIYCHYADMIGGEGNAYGNVFSKIKYLNPNNKGADYDFHGFAQGPFSPPSYMLFELCENFRLIKGTGSIYNQPACGIELYWWNVRLDGYEGAKYIFRNNCYKGKNAIMSEISAIKIALIKCIQEKRFALSFIFESYNEIKKQFVEQNIPLCEHHKLFHKCYIMGLRSPYKIELGVLNDDEVTDNVFVNNLNESMSSLYNMQLNKRLTS